MESASKRQKTQMKDIWKFIFKSPNATFRSPQQMEATESVIAGNDTIIIFLPGSGKTICFELPAYFCKRKRNLL